MNIEQFFKSVIPGKIPEDWVQLHQRVIDGTDPKIPNYGHGMDSHLEYYGVNKGIEKGRVIIPEGSIEHSYHVSHSPNKDFEIVNEGDFPRTD